jgi:hypothetical protein
VLISSKTSAALLCVSRLVAYHCLSPDHNSQPRPVQPVNTKTPSLPKLFQFICYRVNTPGHGLKPSAAAKLAAQATVVRRTLNPNQPGAAC